MYKRQVSTPAARADRRTVFVPASLLRAGVNILAVETHLNYRSSISMSIDAQVSAVPGGAEAARPAPTDPEPDPAPAPAPDMRVEPDPEKPLGALDASGFNFGNFMPTGMYWNYWNSKEAPDAAWNSTCLLYTSPSPRD